MFPTSFDESNSVLSKPKGLEECNCLSVFRGPDPNGFTTIISCWKVTKEELEEINKTGRVWLFIYGRTMPPAALGGLNPFDPATEYQSGEDEGDVSGE